MADVSRPSRAMLMVLGAILLLRAGLVMLISSRADEGRWTGWLIAPDSRDYVYCADDMSDGRIESVSFRTPLYPLLIALTQHLPGRRWLATVLIQQVAVVVTALSCGMLAGRSCGRRAGLAAAAAYALCPLTLIESVALLPDILLGMFVSLAGLAWLGGARTGPLPSAGSAFWSGILLGAATLAKPSASLLLLVPACMALLARGAPLGRRMVAVLIVTAGASGLPLAWRIHNLAISGSPVLTTQDSFELAGRLVIMSGRQTQESFWLRYADSIDALVTTGPIVYEDLACERVPDGWAGLGGGRFAESVDVSRRDSIFRGEAVSAFRSAPLPIILGHFTAWPRFLSNPVGDLGRTGGSGPVRSLVRAGSMAFQALLAAGALLAVLRPGIRRRAGALLLFSLLTFLVVGVVTGPLAGTRYSLPFYWALVCTAACGLSPRGDCS